VPEPVNEPYSASSVVRQLDDCTFCPKMCRHACPVSTASGRETHIPQAKMDQLNQLRLRRGDGPPSARANGPAGAASGPGARGLRELAWTAESTESLWACTGCRHCTMYCDHGNEPGMVLFTGRAEAVRRGAAPAVLARYPERFAARDERLATTARQAFSAHLASEGEIGYWPGCDALDKDSGDIAAAIAVFAAVGVTLPVIDAPQACAGYPLLAAGYPDLFRWHANKVAATLRRFRTVVINCSACLHTVRAQYPAEGARPSAEILSVSEALARSVRSLPKAPRRRQVYFHDPCYHARYCGVTVEPRLVLSALAEVRELAWHGKDTECCGGGGLLPKTMPLVADQMAKRRLAEVQARGGGLVVTSCATCTFMLKRNAPDAVEVADLSTAVARLTDTPYVPPAVPASSADDDA
jgi:dimethylglycine catabolism B